MTKNNKIDIRIFLFGDSLVGKTTLIKNFYDSSDFINNKDYCHLKQFIISNEIILDLKFFDFHEDGLFDINSFITQINQANVLFLLFNLNDTNSFDKLFLWFEEIIKKCDLNNKNLILIGNERYNFESEIKYYKANELINKFSGLYFEINILNEKWKIKEIIYNIIINTKKYIYKKFFHLILKYKL